MKHDVAGGRYPAACARILALLCAVLALTPTTALAADCSQKWKPCSGSSWASRARCARRLRPRCAHGMPKGRHYISQHLSALSYNMIPD